MSNILHDISWVVPLRNEFLTPIFEFFTWLGYPTFVMLLMSLGFWLWNKDKATRVAVIVLISTVLNAYLKDLWENPRPDLSFRLDGEVGNSFGMPSGHAQVSAVLWFWIAYEVKEKWAWLVAGVIVAGICFSRIYLGIHDLEDILVGLSAAVLSVCIYRYCLSDTFKRLRDGPLYLHLVLVLGFGVVVSLSWPPAANSISAIAAVGLLFSWLLGRHIEARLVRFAPRREAWSMLVIAIIGIACLMGVSVAATELLSGLELHAAGILRALLLGLTMTLFAPLLFRLCKLNVSR